MELGATLGRNPELLDIAWATLFKSPEKAEEIPEEHRVGVLTTGYNLWVTSNHLTTTRGAVLFKHLLNVNMVSSSFQYYRDCFLFALSVAWDVDVQRFDLAPEQSQAAFSYVDIMKRANMISPQRGERGRWDRQARVAENVGVPGGRECMGLDQDMSGGDVPGLDSDLALAVWQTILKCDDDAKGVLKEKAKKARRHQKKARKKSRKQGSREGKNGHRRAMADDSDSSSSESMTRSFSSSSSDGGHRSSKKSSAPGSYELRALLRTPEMQRRRRRSCT